jgi:dishevelled associated activator of morphogenesis
VSISASASETKKPKEFSVIDSRRARNCTILLSTLKIPNNELREIILKLDPNDDLPKDTVEQMLKFIPTVEEVTLLEENKLEYPQMAKADRFLYEMSKINRYKQKLKILFFKKKYADMYRELTYKFKITTELCRILMSNKNILNLLEIVLALGNFMNQSQKRSVAVGFSISNLNKLIDIKSSNDRSFSMLHYIINTIQHKVPACILHAPTSQWCLMCFVFSFSFRI